MAKKNKQPKVVVLGWDAADWKLINPLLDAGEMPALQRFVDNGVMGNILTLDPPLSPILWTSIATGKYGDDHGILSFIEPDPETGKRRPISVHSRKVRAIWNILTHEGYKTHVVGWWPSYPTEPINGIQVSNHFADFTQSSSAEDWPIADFHMHPKDKIAELTDLRIHPKELTWAHLRPFMPSGTLEKLLDEDHKNLVGQVAYLLARCSTMHNVATYILENEDWNFIGIYLDSIDKASHEFMKYHPPRQSHIAPEDYELFKDVMSGFYKFHDMMLERLMELIGDDAHMIILSDHGFYSDHRRLETLPKDSMAPAFEHSPLGIVTLKGPGIKKDERIYGSSLLDITPTILQLFGLPIAKDMSGKVLTQAFEKEPIIQYIDSYETDRSGNWGELNENEKTDIWSAQEALEQLIALGYVEALDDTDEALRKQMAFENKYHEARIKQGRNLTTDAITLFEELLADQPANGKILVRLLNAYLAIKNSDQSRLILEKLRQLFGKNNTPYLDLLESKLLMLEVKPREALAFLKSAAQANNATAETFTVMGKNFLLLKEWMEAKKAFKKALQLDTENADAYHGLCISNLRLNKHEEAIEAGIAAISYRYWFPNAHYHLGEALFAAQLYEHAASAFELTLQQQPGTSLARKRLITIYTDYLKNNERLALHTRILNDKMRPQITVVSGLPRSGTSMMMQLLENGGCTILTDHLRQSDENNPKGYLEFEPVKGLMKDNSWMKSANGKTVKIIAQLLGFMDMDCDYKIIFMERDLDEVLVSQQKMLKKDSLTFNTKLKETFEQQRDKTKTWLASKPNIDVIYVDYHEMLEKPTEQIDRIQLFLGHEMDKTAMLAAVDKKLHRNKKSEINF